MPKAVAAIRAIPGLADVTTDREQGGLQLDVKIDRDAASRLRVDINDIDNALSDAFSQRQISTIYADRNQYKVIIEVDPEAAARPVGPVEGLRSLDGRHVRAAVERHQDRPKHRAARHQPPGTVSGRHHQLQSEARRLNRHQPRGHRTPRSPICTCRSSIRGEPAGDAKIFVEQARMQSLLIIAALVSIYIVLGVLYESLVHPLTIISTLPSAGLGALLALKMAQMDLSVIALIGVILLIGIVKKNGIMLVDFALSAERERGLAPEQAIYEACLQRFRPILMTTLAALLGAVPLAIAIGPGRSCAGPSASPSSVASPSRRS